MKKEILRYQRLAGIITESQYIKKLNESVEAPNSITVKILPNILKGAKGYFESSVQLNANSIEKRIGNFEYEMGESKQTFYYAQYIPEEKKISVMVFNCFGGKAIQHRFASKFLDNGYFFDDNKPKEQYCTYASDFDSVFEDGFEVGAKDDRGYFEIIEVGE